jgi:hypothetical protein
VIGDGAAAWRPTDDPVFDPAGPGSWELDAAHFPRPLSRFSAAAFLAGFHRGFAEGLARYGLLLDHVKGALVNGFFYSQPAIFGADEPDWPDGPATYAAIQAAIAPSVRSTTTSSSDSGAVRCSCCSVDRSPVAERTVPSPAAALLTAGQLVRAARAKLMPSGAGRSRRVPSPLIQPIAPSRSLAATQTDARRWFRHDIHRIPWVATSLKEQACDPRNRLLEQA